MKRNSDSINIGIADNNQIMVNSLQAYLGLKEGMNVVLSASNGNELLEKIEIFPPDVLMMNLKIPGRSAFSCIKEIKSTFPDTKILIISDTFEESIIMKCFNLGAHCVFDQRKNCPELVYAISKLYTQGHFFDDVVSKILFSQLNPSSPPAPISKSSVQFNRRELSIIKLVCKEYSCKEIAKELDLSERSVEAYRYRILSKIGAKNAVGIVKYAIENDLI